MAGMSALYRFLRLLGLIVLTLPALAGCGHGKKTPPEQVAAQAYLTALGAGSVATAAGATTDAAAAQPAIQRSITGLGAGAHGTLTVTGLANRTATSATANYTAGWTLPGASGHWQYSGSLPVVKQQNRWLVEWHASDVQPGLTDGNHLEVRRSQPARAELTDGHGAPLVRQTPVVTVGINPAAVTNLPSLARSLAAVPQLQTSAVEVERSVKAAPAGQFVPLITLRQPVYEQLRPLIYNLPGTEFQRGNALLPPETGFARGLFGTVGPATKEIVDGSHGAVAASDQVGLSGLQLALDEKLRGKDGISVYAVPDGDAAAAHQLAVVQPPTPGTPVQLTLDTAAQRAADAAVAGETLPAAIVVTQPSTGRILAVANSAAAVGDIALTGQYPAGSTFKLVTYTAEFLTHPDRTENTTAPCPATVTVDGRTFENENKFAHPTIPYSAAFGYSCNTTAIALADALPDGAQYRAAQQLGLGAKWQLPVDAFSGSMPSTATGTEKAAEAIGQGKVLVSPLLMAEIAGASATGTPRTPTLLADQQSTAGEPLPASLTAKLNALMRATVAMPGATAYSALNGLPGEIRGKTGTAEFGTDVPPESHSWFAGTRGDLAVSVFIYGGEQSTTGAVVLARDFFTALPPS